MTPPTEGPDLAPPHGLASPSLILADMSRLPTLDGIRGLAIVLVLCHNVQRLGSPVGWFARGVEFGLDLGWVGVQLFFVLSGYLITGILLDTKSAPNHFRSFFARRALRIFPLYYLTLVVILVGLPLLGVNRHVPEPSLEAQLPFWLYYSNWAAPFGPPQYSLSHLWSLAVEEQFYWLWPFFIYRLSVQQTLRLCIGVAVAALLIRGGMVFAHVAPNAIYQFSFCRMDALALGGAGAAVARLRGPSDWMAARQGPLLALTVTLVLVGQLITRGYGQKDAIGQTLGYSILSLVFALLVSLAALADRVGNRTALRWARFAPLRALGKYSYGIYVFHWPLHDLVGKPALAALHFEGGSDVAATLLYVGIVGAASTLLAMLSYHLLEIRFLKFKGHFEASTGPVKELKSG